MIAYEELVVALTNWRINQGLPTSAVTFLSQDTGSVDLALPVADPLVAADSQEYSAEDLAVEELGADDYAGEEVVAEEYAGEEVVAEEYAGEEVAAEEYAGEEVAAEEYAGEEIPAEEYAGEEVAAEDGISAESYAAEELPTDTYASDEHAIATELPEGQGLNYDEDTQYAGAPDGVDQTQEMLIDSVTGDDDDGLEAAAEYQADAADSDEEMGISTEEVPQMTDETEAHELDESGASEEQPEAENDGGGDFGGDDAERPVE